MEITNYHLFDFMDFDSDLKKNEEGIISMARGTDPNSASGQFFIVLGEASFLDGEYAAFGKVINGMDIVKKIEAQGTQSGRPKKKIVIEDSGIVE